MKNLPVGLIIVAKLWDPVITDPFFLYNWSGEEYKGVELREMKGDRREVKLTMVNKIK